MNLRRLRRNWDALGKKAPLEAILTNPERTEGWLEEDFFAWGRDEIEGVLLHVESLGGELIRRRALDFGCGVGRLTQALAAHFEQVDGLDIAPSMIRLARRYNRRGDRCRYHLNYSTNLRIFEDDRFDFIYSNITLQHMEPRYAKGYLREFLRVLKPAGVLVFQLPTELDPAKRREAAESEPGEGQVVQAQAVRPEAVPGGRIKRLIRPFVPRPVLELYRGIIRSRTPRMEAYGIPRDEVIDLLARHGGRVLDVQPDRWATGWLGFRYCVTK
ncbi:MAG: class I SAM-dependent methyltransferase [Actinomycetota bacterium]